MLPKLIFDISSLDLNHVQYDQEEIRKYNPQRGAMEHLNGIIWTEPGPDRILGYKDVRHDEFWIEGHIPGRPLLPGVIMVEAAAQLSSFYTKCVLGWEGFVGFGGVESARFRAPVQPGCRMFLLGERVWLRKKILCCRTQGVVNGQITFEANVIGAVM